MKYLILVFATLFSIQISLANCIEGNCKNGKGTYLSKNGDEYAGKFYNHKLNGKGTWKSAAGDIYTGEFMNGKMHGVGKMAYANGSKFIGNFVDGKIAGKGRYYFINGDSFLGHWENGKAIGEGTYRYKNGTEKVTTLKYKTDDVVENSSSTTPPATTTDVKATATTTAPANTQKLNTVTSLSNITKDCTTSNCHEELGLFYYTDGSVYRGEFRNGLPDGVGRCEYKTGDVYEGEWKNHSPNGKGIMHFKDGKSHACEWTYGKPGKQLLKDIDYLASIKNEAKAFDDDVDFYALVVGVANYTHLPSLKYTDDDAYQVYAFLKSPEGGAIPNNNIKVLVDDAATKTNILLAMNQLYSRADKNDVVMLYISGHGLDGSFVPSDFDGVNNKLPYDEIIEVVNQSKAKHKLAILDACHSGSISTAKSADYAPALHKYQQILTDIDGGTAFMMSSSANEVSLETSGLRQGVFSHFLIKGLGGAADSNRNKVVTIEELYSYIHTEVRNYTANSQTPIISGNYNRQMPLAVLR